MTDRVNLGADPPPPAGEHCARNTIVFHQPHDEVHNVGRRLPVRIFGPESCDFAEADRIIETLPGNRKVEVVGKPIHDLAARVGSNPN